MESVVRTFEPDSSRDASLVNGHVVDSDGNPEFIEVFLAVDDFQEGSGLVGVDQVDCDVAVPYSNRMLHGALILCAVYHKKAKF